MRERVKGVLPQEQKEGLDKVNESILHSKWKGRNYQCFPEEALPELSLA